MLRKIQMKKLIILIILILLSNLVIASHLPEINNYPALEKILEKYFGNHNAKAVKLEYSREIIVHKQNLTSYKLNIKYKELRDNKLIVYDILPKKFMDNANEIILDVNTNHTILDNDPIIVHYIANFNNDFTIDYLLTGTRNYNIEEIQEPIFFKSIILPDLRLWIFLLIFSGVIFIFYIIKKIKKVKLKGVRIR